jgi:hypothetical protein
VQWHLKKILFCNGYGEKRKKIYTAKVSEKFGELFLMVFSKQPLAKTVLLSFLTISNIKPLRKPNVAIFSNGFYY